MAQQARALAVKSDDLILTPTMHMMEGKHQLLELFSHLHTHTVECTHTESFSKSKAGSAEE